MLRIIGGKHRSRVIQTPDEGTVPTKNRVREALFSALSDLLPRASVLDLFAGSGALGIEALSRGAKEATFVDSSPVAARIIASNLRLLGEEGEVLNLDYQQALQRLKGKTFDIVFLDPPYAQKEFYGKAISLLEEGGLLSPGAALVIEYEGECPLSFDIGYSARYYKYGYTRVCIARKVTK